MSTAEAEAVRAVVGRYIDGTYRGDVEALRECFHGQAAMTGFLGGRLLTGGPAFLGEQSVGATTKRETVRHD